MGSKPYRFPNRPKLPLIRHKIALEQSYPGTTCTIKRNVLTWQASIAPTTLSRTYSVKIVYDGHRMPQVTIYGESLRGLDKSGFPHKYEIDISKNRVRVCLHLSFELDYATPFSETLVPWTAEWLLHYEIWLATGEWRGGGDHPVVDKKQYPPLTK